MRAIGFAIVVVLLLRPTCLLADDPLSEVAEVVAAMKKAAVFYTANLAVHGGYASSWRRDLSAGRAAFASQVASGGCSRVGRSTGGKE